MITGWKSITAQTGYSTNTLKTLVKKEGFPVLYIANKPTTTDQAIQEWFKMRIRSAKSTK